MADGSTSEDESIWAYVPPGEAHGPEPPAQEKLYTGLSAVRAAVTQLRAWMAGDASAVSGPPGADEALEAGAPLSDALRDQVAPSPDWRDAVKALDDVIDSDSEAGAPLLVHEAGHHDAPSIVEAWGARTGATVMDPPARDRLAEEDGAAWVAAQRSGKTPWVLPRLERWWLRTPDGVAFVRSLLDAWAEGTLGRGVIGVDRHAWRYLRHVWPGQARRRVTLRPPSGEALARWFWRLARQGGAPEGTVEEQDGGGRVLPRPEWNSGRATSPEDETTVSTFLQSLAAHSDGNPGVAWALWRRSLQAPGPEASAATMATVPPWPALDRPGRPDAPEGSDLLLLHALVLHGGLPDAVLAHVTPVERYERRERLRTLHREGLLTKADGAWQVTAAGYPVACALLRDEAYLSDRPDVR
ncbi:hypothetical protein [Salinibacter grassmerensis]|uniref:hypothetical protein n=1 Tax=Salinibacter grassmerensis TaxID=3040353 RepID=UPI0021E947E8|nr:hypothetical protein [Salinibacter grassmerensis]